MVTKTEENYIKTIYRLSTKLKQTVSTNALANAMQTKASSVTDMIKKLSEKNFVVYKKYQGVTLTSEGESVAVFTIRKHRLWEVFLVDKLNFTWDEVHDVAEQLEHIKSDKLVDELDAFLGFPATDPHGDPIPDKNGKFKIIDKTVLANAELGNIYVCVGVDDSSTNFLKYLDAHKIALGTSIELLYKEPFDNSITVKINNKELVVSESVSKNLFVKKL